MVSSAINLGLRGLEFLWTLLVMSLTGNMIAEATAGNASIVNYSMFVSVFAMLSLFYLIPAAFDAVPGPAFVTVVLDGINVLLWFCGAVALAAYLGVHSCSDKSYTRNNLVTNGSVDMEKRCREAQATDAFLWFGFAAFAASAVVSAISGKGRK